MLVPSLIHNSRNVQGLNISLQVAKTIDFEVARGLTNALLAAKKPGEVG